MVPWHKLLLSLSLLVFSLLFTCKANRLEKEEDHWNKFDELKRFLRPHLSATDQETRDIQSLSKDRKKRTSSFIAILKRKLLLQRTTYSSSGTATAWGSSTGAGGDTTSSSSSSGNYTVSTSYGPNGTSITGGPAQFNVIPSSNVYSYCNFVFNGSPIKFKDPVVNSSLYSFLGELKRNGGVLSLNQSCLLLFYWRKRVELATIPSYCEATDPWCKLGSSATPSRSCTPLYCTRKPGYPCLNLDGVPSTCRTNFAVKCIIHCLKLKIKTSDPVTLTNVINQLQFQNMNITTRNSQSSFTKGNFLSSLLKKRNEKEKKQAMALSCGTCGCASGGYTCEACYTNAPNGAPCWDPLQDADCCMCLVLG